MKTLKTKKRAKAITIDMSAKEFEPERAEGVRPGKHTFIRGGFLKRHGVTASDVRRAVEAASKISVSLRLDNDVLTFFKERAADPLAAGYQTQINAVLRQYMEQEKGSS